MRTSIFELFKIGIGPSSSHTVGPMRAAYRFAAELRERGFLASCARVRVELYGSLALTGIGHGTDTAVLLGLSGEKPEEVEPGAADLIRGATGVPILGGFTLPCQIVFHRDQILPGHSNAMRFTAFGCGDARLFSQVYFSIGGGFIQLENEPAGSGERVPVPYPFRSGEELLRVANEHGWPIWKLILENEKAWQSEAEIRGRIARIWSVMRECMERGLRTDGILPGGLHVRRRAAGLARRLELKSANDPLGPADWVNVFAIAVNEENAAGGRVVTAPTNGAAGIIPAVGRYYEQFVADADAEGLFRYFLTAGRDCDSL